MVQSFKAGIKTSKDSEFVYNGLRFGSKEKAETYLRELSSRWFAIRETTITESEDEVTKA